MVLAETWNITQKSGIGIRPMRLSASAVESIPGRKPAVLG
jgi:hypothetical protein